MVSKGTGALSRERLGGIEQRARMNCRESRDDDGLEFLSVLSHSRAKEGKNADAKHARWGGDAETGHGQRVRQRGFEAGYDECNANECCKEELVQVEKMRLSSGKQMETDGFED